MPEIRSPIRLDKLQQSIFDVLSEALAPAQVAWGYGEQTFEAFPDQFCNLQLIGPTASIRQHRQGVPVRPLTSAVVRVTSIDPLQRLLVEINRGEYVTDPLPGDTVTDVRDALLAQIDQDEPDLTVTADGADGILLVSTYVGALWSLALSPGLTATSVVPSPTCVLLTDVTREFSLGVQCFAKGREPRNGAWDLCGRALAAFEADDLGDVLDRAGVGLRRRGPAVDLSSIAGAHWESRISFDLALYMRSRATREIGVIEGANILLNYTDGAGNTVATNTATVP